MSNYHILQSSNNGNRLSIAIHVPVPSVLNDVDINYRIAVVQAYASETGEIPSMVPFIEEVEQTQLNNGELVEVIRRFNTRPGETLLEKRTRIDALYATVVTQVQANLANRLKYWGYSRDVP